MISWTTLTLLQVLGCSLAWSGLDALRKLLSAGMKPLPLVFWLTLGQVPVLAAICIGQPLPQLGVRWALLTFVSVALNVGANVAFVEALERSPISLTVPFLSLTPVATTLLARPLLGEAPTTRQWCGILVVVAGALYLGREPGTRSPRAWLRRLRGEPGVPLMLLVVCAWSLTLPVDKLALQLVAPRWHGLALVTGVAAGTFSLLAARGRLGELRLPPRPMILGAGVVVSSLALVLQLVAMQSVLVGLLETVKRWVGNLMAAVWGVTLFGERVGGHRIAALAAMAAGVALVLV